MMKKKPGLRAVFFDSNTTVDVHDLQKIH